MKQKNSRGTRAPTLPELVLSCDESGRRDGAACAVVLPFHGEIECVRRHLELLASQDDPDFDVILVSSSPHPFGKSVRPSKASSHGTVSLMLRMPLGAGAFYVGQRYAHENGYAVVILADSDAYPVDASLIRKLKGAAISGRNAIHLPSAASAGRGRHSPSIHWYGALHDGALSKSGFTYLPLFFGGVDDELESRMMDSGLAIHCLPDASVSHPLFKPVSMEPATARALNDIRNRGPQLYRLRPFLWPIMPLFTAFSMLSFCDSQSRAKHRMRLALRALLSSAKGSSSPHFEKSDATIPLYPESRVADALSGPEHGQKKAFVLCPKIGDTDSSEFVNKCAASGINTSRILFGEGGNPVQYSLALLCGPFLNGTAIVFSDWRLVYNPFLLLYRKAYVHDGKGTWLVSDTPGFIERLGKCALSCFLFCALAFLYVPSSFISWLRVGKSRLRYGLEYNGKG